MEINLNKEMYEMFDDLKSEIIELAQTERKANHELIRNLMKELKEAYELVQSLSDVIGLGLNVKENENLQ